MEKLEQNSLGNATTDLGFVNVVNANAETIGTSKIALQREVELEDGTIVKVESVTPAKMKSILNEQANDTLTFVTPGENFEKTLEEGVILGIAQTYNEEVENHDEPIPEPINIPIFDGDVILTAKLNNKPTKIMKSIVDYINNLTMSDEGLVIDDETKCTGEPFTIAIALGSSGQVGFDTMGIPALALYTSDSSPRAIYVTSAYIDAIKKAVGPEAAAMFDLSFANFNGDGWYEMKTDGIGTFTIEKLHQALTFTSKMYLTVCPDNVDYVDMNDSRYSPVDSGGLLNTAWFMDLFVDYSYVIEQQM